jgi:TRAP-type C4-dicarboxylate transport system substrate-binding protein
MQFEIFPGSLLGNYIDQQISMMRNQQDFALSWPTSAVAPRADAAWLGYMYEDWDDFQSAFAVGGWMNELISDIYADDANIKLLASMPTSLTGISSTKEFEVRDLDKGIKLRHAPSPVLAARFDSQGFDPIVMNMSEVESALMLDTIDAVGYVSTPQFWQYRETCPYLYYWNDGSNPLQMMVSLDTWNSMPEEDQQIILDVAAEWNE